jgi:hypothetical protein
MEAYVYGVVRAGTDSPRAAEGIDGQQVEVVPEGDLAALVSDAPTVPVRANRRNLTAHSGVLQAVVSERCVLPMRFGVVMPGRDAVREELLERHADRLTAQLDAFEPYVEVDVRVLCPEEAVLRAVLAERRDIADLRASLAGRPPDATYYERIRLGEAVAQAVAQKREAVAELTIGRLAPLAAAVESGDALHEQMLANTAFLVGRGDLAKFDAAVERLDDELGDEIRLSYVGPLAPHNFVDLGAETGQAAWA